MKLIIPLGFSKVNDGIFRSAYPADKTLPYISKLKLKSMVCLCPNDIRPELIQFANDNDIKILESDIKYNQEPFLVMSEKEVEKIVDFISIAENQPSLVFCTNGKVKTGCVVGCLRKRLDNWAMSSIVSEFEQFAEPEGTFSDMLFIENFPRVKEQLVTEVAAATVSSSTVDIME